MSSEFFDEIQGRVDDLTRQIEATSDKSVKRKLSNQRGKLNSILKGKLTPQDLHPNHTYRGKTQTTTWGDPNERTIVTMEGRGLEDKLRYKGSMVLIGGRYPTTTVLLFLAWARRDVTKTPSS